MGNKRIILTGGGTAGYVTPNPALVPKFLEAEFDILYVGSYTGMERELVKSARIDYHAVSLREWSTRKEEFKKREITEDEYFEWKLNWPHTCDNGGLHEPRIQWRNGKIPENTEEYQRYVNRIRGIE